MGDELGGAMTAPEIGLLYNLLGWRLKPKVRESEL